LPAGHPAGDPEVISLVALLSMIGTRWGSASRPQALEPGDGRSLSKMQQTIGVHVDGRTPSATAHTRLRAATPT
jgi:hypothetical protein